MKNAKAMLVTSILLLFALPLSAGTQPNAPADSAGALSSQFQPIPARPLAVAGQGAVTNCSLLHTNQDYQFRCGDLIEVKVYGEEDLAARVRLNEIGTADLPLLPGVALTGLTQNQACERIRQLYMKDFLVDPLISLTILEYGKSKVTVLGQVRTPGVYLFPANERLNLLQAIALAGGYTRIGEPGKIVIKRIQNGKENVIKVDGRAMAKEEGYKMFEIQPDDVISIGESFW